MIMKLTQGEWNHVHRDFKGIIDGQRYRMFACMTLAVEIVPFHAPQQGEHVRANGYEGSVVRQYSAGMTEVRLPGGVACVPSDELIYL